MNPKARAKVKDEQHDSGEFIASSMYSNDILSDEVDEDPPAATDADERKLKMAQVALQISMVNSSVEAEAFQRLMSSGMRLLSSNPARFCSELGINLTTAVHWFDGTHPPSAFVRLGLLKDLQKLLIRELGWVAP